MDRQIQLFWQQVRPYCTWEVAFTICMVFVNLGNYLLNLVLGRLVGPEVFSEVGVIATMVLIMSFVAIAIQLTAARLSAQKGVEEGHVKAMEGYRKFRAQVGWLGALVSIFLLTGVGFFGDLLGMSSYWSLALVFASIPLHWMISAERGMEQGREKFDRLSYSYLLEMVSRVALTLAIVFGVSTTSIIHVPLAVALGFIGSFILVFLVSVRDVRLRFRSVAMREWDPALYLSLGTILLYEGAQVLINNMDVLQAKQYFLPHLAGQYAALALIGRVVYFGTWMIVMVLFPKVINKVKNGEDPKPVLMMSMSFVLTIGLAIIGASVWQGDWIVQVLFGPDYISIANLLPLYATSTLIFALANVLVYFFMSIDKYLPVLLSILAGAIQFVGIAFLHTDLEALVWVQIMAMSSFFGALVIYYIYFNLKSIQNEIGYSFSLSSK